MPRTSSDQVYASLGTVDCLAFGWDGSCSLALRKSLKCFARNLITAPTLTAELRIN